MEENIYDVGLKGGDGDTRLFDNADEHFFVPSLSDWATLPPVSERRPECRTPSYGSVMQVLLIKT